MKGVFLETLDEILCLKGYMYIYVREERAGTLVTLSNTHREFFFWQKIIKPPSPGPGLNIQVSHGQYFETNHPPHTLELHLQHHRSRLLLSDSIFPAANLLSRVIRGVGNLQRDRGIVDQLRAQQHGPQCLVVLDRSHIFQIHPVVDVPHRRGQELDQTWRQDRR